MREGHAERAPRPVGKPFAQRRKARLRRARRTRGRRGPSAAKAGKRGEARAERADQRHRDAGHEQRSETAHHRHRRQQQHEETHRRGHSSGEDRRPTRGRGGHGRLALSAGLCLIEAGLELDGVVHRQADQHGEHGDRGHRQVAAHERQAAEGHRRGGERERQREQPQPRPEHERQRGRHQEQRRDQQDEDRAAYGVRQPLGDHRHPGHDVASALLGPEPLLRSGLLDQLDGPGALGFGQIGAHADLDQRGVAGREQVGEARLGRARLEGAGVEHERGDEVRVVDARDVGEPVAQAQLQHLLHEARLGGLRGPPAPGAAARRESRRAGPRACGRPARRGRPGPGWPAGEP